MAFIVEDGTGVPNANSLITVDFFKEYHKERGNAITASAFTGTQNIQIHCIRGTQHFESNFGISLRGSARFADREQMQAIGFISFTDQPTNLDTVTIGTQIYRFVNTLAAANDVLIGATLEATVNNFISAIGDTGGAGTVYGTGTVANTDAEVTASTFTTISLEAKAAGRLGNSVAISKSSSNISVGGTTFSGGADKLDIQSLSLPRKGLYYNGVEVEGVPVRIQQAIAEFSYLDGTGTLQADLTGDELRGDLKLFRKKTGPLEKEYQYQDGARRSLVDPYPRITGLIRPFLRGGSTTIRN